MNDHYYDTVLDKKFKAGTLALIEYLRSVGLLQRNVACPNCSVHMPQRVYKRNIDGVAFRCMTRSCQSYKKYTSIREGSIFENFSSTLEHLMKMIFKWSGCITQKEIRGEVARGRLLVSKLVLKLRRLTQKYFLSNPVILGGRGIICQIDESLFRHKPKFHRGRATNHELWVFGIADTSYTPAKIYLDCVPDRTALTLLPIISRVCRADTIIHSDEWAAYNNVGQLYFEHGTVKHKLHFVNPETGVHTQNVESYWAKRKYRVKLSKGVYGEHLALLLCECMFKDNVMRDDFCQVIDLIKLYY